MEPPNNRRYEVPVKQLLLASETFRVRNGQPNQAVGQRIIMETQTTQAIAETIDLSPQNHGKVRCC